MFDAEIMAKAREAKKSDSEMVKRFNILRGEKTGATKGVNVGKPDDVDFIAFIISFNEWTTAYGAPYRIASAPPAIDASKAPESPAKARKTGGG